MGRGIESSFGRFLNYVRISVTDRCNFRCRYCMPSGGIPTLSHEEIMSYEDILFLAKTLSSMGVRRLRFTGGEPFVRKDFVPFLEKLRSELPELAVAVTTNGSLMKPWAKRLGDLDLDGISVSLDSLNPERFRDITRLGDLGSVIEGIDALVDSSNAVKLNTVIVKGFNDDELPDLLGFARERGALLRLIEFMPLDSDVWFENAFVSVDDMIDGLPDRELWIPERPSESGTSGPSVYYRNRTTGQRLGLIAAVSHHFCDRCNRLRITSDGEVRPCLFDVRGRSVMSALRNRCGEDLVETIAAAALDKPECWTKVARGESHMSRIGG